MKTSLIRIISAILLLCTVTSVTLIGCSVNKETTYTSTAKYMMSKVNMTTGGAATGLNAGEVEAMQILIANAREICNTNDYALEVADRIETKYEKAELSASDIISSITVNIIEGTTCFYFSATTNDPDLSYYIADVGGEYLIELYRGHTAYAISFALIDTPKIPSAPDNQ